MKTQDVLLLTGIGLAVYALMPKPKAAEDGGSTAPVIITTGQGSPFDIGGLLSGMAGLFQGAMPSNLVPEINIPEFKWPVIDIPEIPAPDWSKMLPDWSTLLPDWEQFIPEPPDELKIPSLPEFKVPDISINFPVSAPKKTSEPVSDWSRGLTGIKNAFDFILGGWQQAPPYVKYVMSPALYPAEKIRDFFYQRNIAKPTEIGAQAMVEAGITQSQFASMNKVDREAFFALKNETQITASQPETGVYFQAFERFPVGLGEF